MHLRSCSCHANARRSTASVYASRRARRASSWPCRAASTARSSRRCWPRRATTSSASRCSSTTTARRWRGKGACCAGRDIHDARRVAEAMGFPHYVLDYESRFRDERDRRVRRRLPRRRDAGALHPLQRAGEVPRPAGDRARPRRRLHGDRPLRPARRRRRAGRSCTAPPIRRATRATSCSRPRASSSASCASRSAGSRPRPRPGRWRRATGCRSPTSPTARTSASCRTAPMPR